MLRLRKLNFYWNSDMYEGTTEIINAPAEMSDMSIMKAFIIYEKGADYLENNTSHWTDDSYVETEEDGATFTHKFHVEPLEVVNLSYDLFKP